MFIQKSIHFSTLSFFTKSDEEPELFTDYSSPTGSHDVFFFRNLQTARSKSPAVADRCIESFARPQRPQTGRVVAKQLETPATIKTYSILR